MFNLDEGFTGLLCAIASILLQLWDISEWNPGYESLDTTCPSEPSAASALGKWRPRETVVNTVFVLQGLPAPLHGPGCGLVNGREVTTQEVSGGFVWDCSGEGKNKEPASSLINSCFSDETTGLSYRALLGQRWIPSQALKVPGVLRRQTHEFSRRQFAVQTEAACVQPALFEWVLFGFLRKCQFRD